MTEHKIGRREFLRRVTVLGGGYLLGLGRLGNTKEPSPNSSVKGLIDRKSNAGSEPVDVSALAPQISAEDLEKAQKNFFPVQGIIKEILPNDKGGWYVKCEPTEEQKAIPACSAWEWFKLGFDVPGSQEDINKFRADFARHVGRVLSTNIPIPPNVLDYIEPDNFTSDLKEKRTAERIVEDISVKNWFQILYRQDLYFTKVSRDIEIF